MAKRKRLTPAQPDYLQASAGTGAARPAPAGPLPTAPIAQVAGEAAASAALSELSQEMEAARAEGRLMVSLPLDAIDAGYLVRDRLVQDEDEMQALIASLISRGQQTPIEVVALPEPKDGQTHGLISGWRRCLALERLQAETGEARFGKVLALLRRPSESAEAYVAMIEENEIRVGLSYYERARIAMKAAEQGAFPSPKKAVLELFRASSRPKRSKIHSFLVLVEALDGSLRFPGAIPERLGLRMAKLLAVDPGAAELLARGLAGQDPQTPDEETGFLDMAMGEIDKARKGAPREKPGPREHPTAAGLTVKSSHGKIVITGALASDDLAASIATWLKNTRG